MSPAKSFPAFPFAMLLVGGMAIGFAGIFMRLSDVNPLASAFWRMAIAAPLLWCWVLASRPREAQAGQRTHFSRALALAGVFFGFDMATWHLSLDHTTVANATLLSNFAPIFIALWMWLAWRTRFSRLFLVGMACAFVGAVLLIGPNAGIGQGRWLGDAFGLISAVFYAAYQLVVKQARNVYSTARLMAWSSTISACVLLPCALIADGPMLPGSLVAWWPLLGLGLVAQIGGQTVIAYAFAHLPAALSSVSLLIQPLTAAVAAWFIFREGLLPMQFAGGALLLLGLFFARKGS